MKNFAALAGLVFGTIVLSSVVFALGLDTGWATSLGFAAAIGALATSFGGAQVGGAGVGLRRLAKRIGEESQATGGERTFLRLATSVGPAVVFAVAGLIASRSSGSQLPLVGWLAAAVAMGIALGSAVTAAITSDTVHLDDLGHDMADGPTADTSTVRQQGDPQPETP